MSTPTLNIGMPSHKLIKRKLIINCALPDKHRLMNGFPSRPKSKDRLELKWRNKAFLLMKERINR